MELKELHENSLFSYNSKDSGLELECDLLCRQQEENCPMKAEYQKQFVVSSGFSHGCSRFVYRQSVGALNKVGMKNCGRKERQMVDLLHTDSQVCNSKNKDPHMHACLAALAGKPYTETAVGSCYLALRYNVSGGQVPALRSHFPLLKCYHKQTHGQSLLTAR